MKTFLVILLLNATIAFGQSNPCQKKYFPPWNKNMYQITLYPNCNDTTLFLIRIYEDNKLRSEEWIQNNKLNGLSIYYSHSNGKSSETYWENNVPIQSIKYFTNSSIISISTKRTSDTTDFEINYFENGNIKEYGNTNSKLNNCHYGQWIEQDSLGTYKWEGGYKIVDKSKSDPIINKKTGVTLIPVSLSEKNGIWKKINSDNKVIEQVLYVDGKLIENH